MNEQKLKQAILNESMKLIPFEGWSITAMREASIACNLDENFHKILFPLGPIELFTFFIEQLDFEMKKELEKLPLKEMKVKEKIFQAIRIRLSLSLPYKFALKRAISFLLLPQNLTQSCKLNWRTADVIWAAIGDTSTDFNYYTKRAILGAVYSSTLLFWVNDHSENQVKTEEFLRRRIDNALSIGKIKQSVSNTADKVINLPFIRLLKYKK